MEIDWISLCKMATANRQTILTDNQCLLGNNDFSLTNSGTGITRGISIIGLPILAMSSRQPGEEPESPLASLPGNTGDLIVTP